MNSELIEAVARLANFDRDLRRFLAPTFGDGEQQLQQIFLQTRHDAPDHAEIEKRDAVIGRDENVARMRISVEKPFDQNLVEISAEEFLGQRLAVQFHARERTQPRDFRARHILHREHT